MHQQVRVSTIKSSSDDAARSDEGSLVDILSHLKGINLRSAGGTNLDSGGEFVFSVRHRPNDDTADELARDLLNENDYHAEVYKIRYCLLDDAEGALLECIQSTEAELNEPVVEVHVLTSEPNRKVPVQIVTRSMLAQHDEPAG